MINHSEVLKLYEEGKTDDEIANLTGDKKKNVQNWRYRYGLKMNIPDKKYVIDEVKALILYMGGMSDTDMSKELGCSVESVRRWRELNSYPTNQPIFTWQRHIKPSKFEKIPEKYRDPKLWSACR
jgi:uncharacterized protein YjcR